MCKIVNKQTLKAVVCVFNTVIQILDNYVNNAKNNMIFVFYTFFVSIPASLLLYFSFVFIYFINFAVDHMQIIYFVPSG